MELHSQPVRIGPLLAILSGAPFVASLDLFVVNVAFGDIAKSYPGHSLGEFSWILNSYAIVYAALLIPLGRWADRIGHKRAFIAGLPDWTIVAALVERGRPTAAAIFAPATEELFLATAAGGATRNGAPIVLPAKASFDGARIAGSRSIVERLARRHKVEKLPRIHSLALRLVRVATGEADAALAAAHAHDWDIAAADLVLREAGGLLTEFDGRVPQYNRSKPLHGALAAAARTMHPALLRALADSLEKPDKIREYAHETAEGAPPRE